MKITQRSAGRIRLAWITYLIVLISAVQVQAQEKLKIKGQRSLSTESGKPITLKLTDFTIEGPGQGQYPTDFRLHVYDGANYSVAGTTVTPEAGFVGKLKVEIKIDRYKNGDVKAESEKTKIDIQVEHVVAQKIVITGQKSLSTTETNPITLNLSDFTITGPGENEYPKDFRLEVFAGDNYSVAGSTVTANAGFKGNLTVDIRISRVKGGSVVAESDRHGIKIEVKEGSIAPPPNTNTPPQIIGQKAISVNSNQTAKIEFSHLTVVDPDNKYPNGFTLQLTDGANYSIASGTSVVPDNNFAGTLTVKTIVNDGRANSPPFDLKISVVPENEPLPPPPTAGPPVFTNFSDEKLTYAMGNTEFYIAHEIEISDPDSESLLYTEIYFGENTFVPGKDELLVQVDPVLTTIFDADVGMLLIFGKANLAVYQQAIQSIRYNFANDTFPAIKQRTVYFRMNDGENFSEIKSKVIDINEGFVLDIPNVFSPNRDDSNDLWKVKLQRQVDNINSLVKVFDKRGMLVFQTDDLDNYWDGSMNGELLPVDSYYYVIEISTGSARSHYQGVVTILR